MGRFFMNSKFLYLLMACVSIVSSGQVIDDKDGYADKDELHAGIDLKDSLSIIYEGGWPYNSEKDLFSTDGFGEIS